MNEEQTALSRRAVACKGWKWRAGMRAVPTEGMVTVPLRCTDDHDWPHDLGLRLPDLSDPATLGCLLALVREAWGQGDMGASRYGARRRRWCVEFTPHEAQNYAFYGSSEAEALVAALENAP